MTVHQKDTASKIMISLFREVKSMKISNSYYGEKSKFELLEQIVNAHKNVVVFYDSLYDRSMIERFFENKDVDVNRFPFAELESDRSVYLVPKTCTSGWKSNISNTVVFYKIQKS